MKIKISKILLLTPLVLFACGTENTDNSKADKLVRIETGKEIQERGVAYYAYDSNSALMDALEIKLLSHENLELGTVNYNYKLGDVKVNRFADEKLNNQEFMLQLYGDISAKVFNDYRVLERRICSVSWAGLCVRCRASAEGIGTYYATVCFYD